MLSRYAPSQSSLPVLTFSIQNRHQRRGRISCVSCEYHIRQRPVEQILFGETTGRVLNSLSEEMYTIIYWLPWQSYDSRYSIYEAHCSRKAHSRISRRYSHSSTQLLDAPTPAGYCICADCRGGVRVAWSNAWMEIPDVFGNFLLGSDYWSWS